MSNLHTFLLRECGPPVHHALSFLYLASTECELFARLAIVMDKNRIRARVWVRTPRRQSGIWNSITVSLLPGAISATGCVNDDDDDDGRRPAADCTRDGGKGK